MNGLIIFPIKVSHTGSFRSIGLFKMDTAGKTLFLTLIGMELMRNVYQARFLMTLRQLIIGALISQKWQK
jgi:hypothetical protein